MDQHEPSLSPILEFDPAPEALIEPGRVLKRLEMMPEHCVLCFFQPVIEKVCKDALVLFKTGSEIGSNPIYLIEVEGKALAVMHPGVGGPLAGGFLEEIIALGCRKFIACGGAGVLRPDIALGHVVVPTGAIRDEGTSYHYLPASRSVAPHPSAVAAIEATLTAHDVPFEAGMTWTTDAIYRETPAKIARRKAEGCITVEMEAATFFAIAQFRGVVFGQMLYGGDDVSGETWDHRGWHREASTRETLFWLAAEAVLRL